MTAPDDTQAERADLDTDEPKATDGDVVLEVRDLVKTYRLGFFRKRVEAVSGVSFEVRRGEIFGLLGPNGAGKTSTLKTVLRLTFPTSGEIRIFGLPNVRRESMKRVGYMPENPYVYQYLKPLEFLDLCGRLVGMKRKERRIKAEQWAEAVGLGHALDRPIGRFSKGMMQRVGLAQALLHDPELLILDEPMSGLDPIGRKEVRDILLAQRAAGKTLIFTSHILSDVEMLCDRVAILREGKMHAEGTLATLLDRDGDAREVEVAHLADPEAHQALLAALETHGQVDVGPASLRVSVHGKDACQAAIACALEADAEIFRVASVRGNLETFFTDQTTS